MVLVKVRISRTSPCKVGHAGKVIAVEVQRPLVDSLHNRARELGYDNVEVVWADAASHGGTKLPDAAADFVVIINTLYQIEDVAAAVAEVYRTLRPHGIVYVVDWIDSFDGLGPSPSNTQPNQ